MSDSTAEGKHDKILFWGCFISLIATAFGFIIRALIIGDWQADFSLTETEKGTILGVGLWPFAISIVLFSLIIDKIGYGKAMAFAWICHISSAIITIMAKDYTWLWVGTFIAALGNGTIEAVINPVVATVFRNEKTKWLNILHAGWPGGLVIGGMIALLLIPSASWQVKVGLVFIPTIIYGVMLFGRKFPVHERVEAGVSYRDMLSEVGGLGALLVTYLIGVELGRAAGIPEIPVGAIVLPGVPVLIGIAVATAAFFGFTRSFGNPFFLFLLLVMIPLATTELGTDAWISELMEPAMANLGLSGGWVLVYTSFVMMVLRFNAGPIVHRISPIGLLALSAVLAILGLVALSASTGLAILLAATLYACGKTFFWPTMLGVVAERCPKGGAMTMNTIAGVGMLSVGIVGAPLIGTLQDTSIGKSIAEYDQKNSTELHATYTIEKPGIFGAYDALDQEKVAEASEEEATILTEVSDAAKKGTLAQIAILPTIMLICYLGLIVYFRSQGGYKVVHIDAAEAAPEEY